MGLLEINFKETITYKACDEILEIAKDFFNLTGITYFNFVRAYDDGTRLYLTNSRAWAEFIFENHAKYHFAFEESTDNLTSQYLIWDLIPAAKADELIKIAREDFDIDHGMTLINRYDDYTEFCYFATGKNNAGVNQFYSANVNLFYYFILYLKDKANRIIHQADDNRFSFNQQTKEINFHQSEKLKFNSIKKYFLSGKFKNIYLTQREAECICFLYTGASPKEIAKLLQISHRTIEGYIENAKIKLRVNSKNELFKVLNTSGFDAIRRVVEIG